MYLNSGIYAIINLINNKCYIGQTINIERRKKQHLRALRKGIHANNHLQASFLGYGEKNFLFKVLMFCPEDELDKYEEWFISVFDSTNHDKGYNILAHATECPTKNEEVKSKLFSEEHRRHLSQSLRKELPDARTLYGLWEVGFTLDEIGGKYNCSGVCIGNRIKEAGLSIDKPNSGRRKYNWVPKASVKKGGIEPYNNKQKYQLIYNTKVIKSSIHKEILEEIADLINNGLPTKNIDDEYYKRLPPCISVRKIGSNFKWFYEKKYTDGNKSFFSSNLFMLYVKVKQHGLDWDYSKFQDEFLIDKEKTMKKFPLKILNVTKQSRQSYGNRPVYVYTYKENGRAKSITALDPIVLKKKVLDKNLNWLHLESI